MADEYIELEVQTDEIALADEAVAKLRAAWDGWEPNDGDLELVLLEMISTMAADAAITAASVPAEIFAAFGEDLAGVAVQLGGYATTTLRFTLLETTGMTIPEGTEVDIDGYIFETDQGVTSAPGAATLDVTATATEVGSGFNGHTGGSVTMVSSVAGIDDVAVLTTTQNGTDPETTEDYLDRLSQAMELRGVTLVTERDYEIMALTETDGVGKVVAQHMGARAVRVTGIDPEGLNLSTQTKDELQALYAAYRMVNTTVTITDPTRTTVNVTYAVKAYPEYDLVALEAQIDAKLAQFLSPATWGEPPAGSTGARWYNEPRVRVNKIIDEIGDVPGVNYVVTVTLSASGVTPESNGDLILPGNVPLPEPGLMTGTVT